MSTRKPSTVIIHEQSFTTWGGSGEPRSLSGFLILGPGQATLGDELPRYYVAKYGMLSKLQAMSTNPADNEPEAVRGIGIAHGEADCVARFLCDGKTKRPPSPKCRASPGLASRLHSRLRVNGHLPGSRSPFFHATCRAFDCQLRQATGHGGVDNAVQRHRTGVWPPM